MRVTVAEFDDYPIHAERMITQMDTWKSMHDGFKATMYAIPALMKKEHWDMVEERKEWLRLGVHGFQHRRAECRTRTSRFYKVWMSAIKDMPYDKICKPPFYGYGKRYAEMMTDMGYALSCRHANDVLRWFDSPLRISNATMYSKYEMPYARMFGHPKNSPFMFLPWTKKENETVLRGTEKFMFASEVAEKMSMIYLGSGEHQIAGFDNLDKDAKGASKWVWGEPLPYYDNTVSFVLIQQSLMYAPLDMYPAIFSEIKRVLCTGGRVLIKEDNAEKYIWKPIGYKGVASHNTPQIVMHYLEEAGLEVVTQDSLQLCTKYEKLVNRVDKVKKGWIYLIEAVKKGGRR